MSVSWTLAAALETPLLAAEQCGEVTGVDPATRLLEIARAQAASEGKNVTFLPGDAASFPVGDSAMPFAWEQREALLSLLGSRGFSVEVTHHALAFTGSSAREFLDDQARNHPMAVAGLSVLEQLGQAEALRARLLAILENGNEDAGKFRVTSRYVIATARRQR